MWGHLCTELSNFSNFNVSFSTHKSEVLIHLSQWQYWWWFWFSFFWTFYFFVILRVIKHRVFKMNIRLNTSFRSRGKWGDYLVTLIPLSWCLNILLNSNFILRMIEWQSESGNLILRIHGKQWYWVYKYDLSNVTSFLETPKNLGNNKWRAQINGGSQTFDNYLQAAQSKIKFITNKELWEETFVKEFNPTSTFTVSEVKNSIDNLKSVSKIKLDTFYGESLKEMYTNLNKPSENTSELSDKDSRQIIDFFKKKPATILTTTRNTDILQAVLKKKVRALNKIKLYNILYIMDARLKKGSLDAFPIFTPDMKYNQWLDKVHAYLLKPDPNLIKPLSEETDWIIDFDKKKKKQ